ncbi:hypothetical protein PQ459_15475 [Chryseobacterium sp. KACC 21268]|nr:hypothetical protein PQ459_15475 [Chryseobacterium sp. KACC 21268]
MKKILSTILVSAFFVANVNAQDLREEVTLNGATFKISDVTSNDEKSEQTRYQVVGNQNEKIEHIARIFDKKLAKETYLGIYRKNDSELHFIEFNQTKTPATLNHYVYAPNNKGKLMLVKKEFDLADFPKDLPPKFKNNQPIHPEFPGGTVELNKWSEKNLVPILRKTLASKDVVLTLEIDSDGTATLQNLSLLALPKETEKALLSKIAEMPKWTTLIQGYKLTGVVFIPLSL